MRVVVAPDSFTGTLTAVAAAAAVGAGWRSARPRDVVREVPVADGGEGTVAAVAAATGAVPRTARVADPLGRPVDAEWLLLDDGTALVETAAASGLWRLAPEERNPRRTTTRGTGELVRAALDAGARRVVLGLGGSATIDGGAGLCQALGVRLLDAAGTDLDGGGGALSRLDRVDVRRLDPRLRDVELVAAADVDSPLLGPDGASAVFGPQKGADPAAVADLDAGLARWATVLRRDLPTAPHVTSIAGGGAAGGLGAGLVALCGARLEPGAALVIGLVGLRDAVDRADVVVTGEGSLDHQTLRGKAPYAVAALARDAGRPCLALAGVVRLSRPELAAAGFEAAYAIADVAPSRTEAMSDAALWLAELAGQVAREWSR